MSRKSGSGVGKARSYGVNKSLKRTTTRNLGFGDFSESTPTAEGERLLKAVQNASVGTEITVKSRDSRWDYSENEVYRVTGTTHEKRLVSINPETRKALREEGLDSIDLKDRDSLMRVLSPLFSDNRSTTLKRTPLTSQERRDIKAEKKKDRQRRAAERRQFKINFD